MNVSIPTQDDILSSRSLSPPFDDIISGAETVSITNSTKWHHRTRITCRPPQHPITDFSNTSCWIIYFSYRSIPADRTFSLDQGIFTIYQILILFDMVL